MRKGSSDVDPARTFKAMVLPDLGTADSSLRIHEAFAPQFRVASPGRGLVDRGDAQRQICASAKNRSSSSRALCNEKLVRLGRVVLDRNLLTRNAVRIPSRIVKTTI